MSRVFRIRLQFFMFSHISFLSNETIKIEISYKIKM